jgi:curved DNA binding protein
MSDDEMGSEEEVDQTLTNSEVVVKYRTAGQVASNVIAKVIEAAVDGKNVLELCELGDKLILEGVKNQYKTKKYEKGVAFPTCISVNHIAGHYSPEAGDKAALKDGDVVKIDLGVHLDGFIAVAAHTHVVGNAQGKVTTGKTADAICAAHIAGEAILRLLKPGQKNTDIADVVKKITDTFHVTPVDAVLSHQMKRFVIDGTKVIPNKHVADQAVEEFEFEENEVYAIDVVVSTGSGKTRELDLRPTIYKRDVDQTYLLKLQAARKIFSEINQKAPSLPFNIRVLEEKHVRFGLGELEKHGLIHPYPVLYEREGEIVAQFKYTALVGPNGASRITQLPLPYVQSQYSVEDEAVKSLLAQSVTSKKKKKSAKKAKVSKEESSEAAPMDTN